MNPLRAWFEHRPRPMLQVDFAELTGMSQSFLTTLLSDRPPWPSRATMRKITEVTKGAVTADMWAQMPDPLPRDVNPEDARWLRAYIDFMEEAIRFDGDGPVTFAGRELLASEAVAEARAQLRRAA